jgi:NADPH:quinone reductase-like Zn-dependent oxidoreductase
MRAIVYDTYGPPEVLESRLVPSPEPGPGQVRVRVRAAGLNPKDSLLRRGKLRRLAGDHFPRRVGFDVAGVVNALGPGVTRFRPGDEVFGMKNGWDGGTVAEEVCLDVDELTFKPARLGFEEAAAVPLAALTALQALRDHGVLTAGQRLLIHGASGGVGLFAIQLARLMGAQVTTTSSARNLELCTLLGAHHAWDYSKQTGLEPGCQWDVFFDVFGNRNFGAVRPVLKPRGIYVSTVPSIRLVMQQGLSWLSAKRARLVVVNSNRADLERLGQWLQDGGVRPVIDRVLPLTQVAEGQAHVETKRARGKVVIRVDG